MRFVAAGLLWVVVFTSLAFSQEISTYSYGDWVVSCNVNKAKLPCSMSHRVVDGKSGKQILGLSVVAPEEGPPHIGASAPLGVVLPGGVRIAIDETEVLTLPFLVCTASGCKADTTLADDVVTSLSTGKKASAAISIGGGKQVNIPFSTKGFADAYAKLLSFRAQ